MAPYSMDLRTRVLRDSDAGLPSKEVATKYAVSRAWVDRVKQRRRETGEVEPRQQTTFRRRVLAGYEDRLERHSININQALFDRISETPGVLLVRDPTIDLFATTCVPYLSEALAGYCGTSRTSMSVRRHEASVATR